MKRHITKAQNTLLCKKMMPEAANKTVIDAPATEYSGQITLVAEFLLYLLSEREKLSGAINHAKAELERLRLWMLSWSIHPWSARRSVQMQTNYSAAYLFGFY